MESVPFDALRTSALRVDAVYQGGRAGNAGDDPVSKLLPVGVQGGFRVARPRPRGSYLLVALVTSGKDPDWPDELDTQTGIFTYYGDNKRPGRDIHNTKLGGNALLRDAFSLVHGSPPAREAVPPFFVFQSAGKGRDVIFRGLAVPGAAAMTEAADLIALWRTKEGVRFQNYRATFTILDVAEISAEYINVLATTGTKLGDHCPAPYREWLTTGHRRPLRSAPTLQWRTKAAQVPRNNNERAMIDALHSHFRPSPTDFEACAVRLWQMQAGASIGDVQVTQPVRDRGRDAIGRFSIGPMADRLHMEFALEAKCYSLDRQVGVREAARLISRLRHRQFGVLVTTSFVGAQAYQELREDRHPVVILSARDLVDILRTHGLAGPEAVRSWVRREFPAP